MLDGNVRRNLAKVCQQELLSNGQGDVLKVIDDFVQFCERLLMPVNHIMVETGQYVEKQVNARTYRGMSDEMAQGLEEEVSYY